jgi:aspartyl-tRNA(Asn)/glutamyl-tRNA(Gln) amidotransferase subunit A
MSLSNLTITQILELFRSKKLTSVELVSYYLDQIEKLNTEYNVFLFVRDKNEILEEAKAADILRAEGSSKKLLGIPFSLKDSYMALGTPTTAGDLYLDKTMSEYNATITQRLLDEGGILLGKVNMDSWGFGSSTENSSYGVTRNAYDKDRVAGGSSGGSAASVALDLCTFSIAEDTGGSVRNPASFNGLFGLKPTYGRIPRFGCIAYASSLDTVAPIARSAEDIELIFSVIKGADGFDMTIEDREPNTQIKKKFAWSNDFIPAGLNPDTKKLYLETIEKFKELGYEAVECTFPQLKYAITTYYITAMSETSTNLSRYHGTRYGKTYKQFLDGDLPNAQTWEDLFRISRSEGLNKEAKKRVFLGSYMLSEGYYDAYYKKAQKIRNIMGEEMNKTLNEVDFILSPVTPGAAMKIGEKTTNPVEMYLEDIYTVTANLVGIPSIAFPAGKSSEGLPIGMQIMGERFSDEKLLEVLKAWE